MMRHRDVQPEVMDQPGLSSDLHRAALAALGRINRISRTDSVLWAPIERLALADRTQPVRVLDVACGDGSVVRSLARRARRARLPIEFSACDVSELAIEFAAEASRREGLPEIRFFVRDVCGGTIPTGFDVITCTLFLHHLLIDDAERLLTGMSEAAGRLLLVDDLCRTRAGYIFAWCGGRLLTRSPVVHVDGPRSVRAAFTRDELRGLARRCGLTGATLQTHWPQRMLLTWERRA